MGEGGSGPLVSAIIPVYNGRRFLLDAVDSVLAQTYSNVECIVVDDGSTDGSRELANSRPDVRVISQPRSGVSAARNRGGAEATGEYLAFLDADDVWLPSKLEVQVQMALDDAAEFVVCGFRTTNPELCAPGLPQRLHSEHPLALGLILFDGRTSGAASSSTLLCKREAFKDLGGYSEDLSTSADLDLLVRAALRHQFSIAPEPLALCRVHGSNMSKNVRLMESDMRLLIRRAEKRVPEARDRATRRAIHGSLNRMLAGSYLEAGQR
jgi:glycosyltransferase involved in cell wall biosynthesis